MILITGQFRHFEQSWENLEERVILPANSDGFEVHVYIGMDSALKKEGVGWTPEEKQQCEEDMARRAKESQTASLSFLWIDRGNCHMQDAVRSIECYRQQGKLSHSWFDYLVHRSGSCFEYAQFNVLMNKCIEEQSPFGADDLLMRTRTDIYLRDPLRLGLCMQLPSFPMDDSSIARVLSKMFPHRIGPDYLQEKSIETSIITPQIRESFSDRWILTLRKNLIYVVPLRQASIIMEVARHYGDWDTVDRNTYWFNAESQFRGCLRHHDFAVVEYSQGCDEFFCGDLESPDMKEKLPIYAILR